jgi:lipopolysaccharide transport system ATP-binding protein
MYMRLAFAVAAHLDTEIVLVDEVLAVGDVAFQQKCLGKMGDVAASGRTVLLVSHNMQAVRALCPRTIVLAGGRVIADGPTGDALRTYDVMVASARLDAQSGLHDAKFRRGSGAARFTSIVAQGADGVERWEFEPGETIRFVLDYDVHEALPSLAVAILFRGGVSKELVTTVRHVLSRGPVPAAGGRRVVIELPAAQFRPGEFALYFGLADVNTNAFDVVDELTRPLVVSSTRGFEELGYDPASNAGFLSIPSTVIQPDLAGRAPSSY